MNRLRKFIYLGVVLSMIFGSLGAALVPRDQHVSRIHPAVHELASESPGQRIGVIVQKISSGEEAESLALDLGADITRDLSIINAFAAEMSVEAAIELSRSRTVRWVSPDAPVVEANGPNSNENWGSFYTEVIGAKALWSQGLRGTGITVAVVDSGITHSTTGGSWQTTDFNGTGKDKNTNRILFSTKFNSFTNSSSDKYGHGTHIAGLIGGNGTMSGGLHVGVAPNVNLLNIKVSDDVGAGTEGDVVAGLQWVLNNKAAYNIRVVNVSLNSSLSQSYHTSPLAAAVEILWFNGIVVVVSAGNNGSTSNGILFPPANDPFVITVGAINDNQTVTKNDDSLASFSAFGTTQDGVSKPDLVAPGVNLIAPASWPGSTLISGHATHKVGTDYFRMSGTSMAAAVTSGAVALLLQDEPGLNPDQVKHRLMSTASPVSYASAAQVGSGLLNIYAAVHATTSTSSNTGLTASQLLWTGNQPITWGSVAWNSVAWNSVAWNSVAWNSVAWNSVAWNSVSWNE